MGSIINNIARSIAAEASGSGLDAAVFTANPSSLDLGTSSSGYIDVSSDRLTGFSVSLTGAIASVASVATELGSAIGGCSSSAGQDCRVTVTRTGGTPGSSYTGNIVLTDESGNTQNVAVELDFPFSLKSTAQSQSAKYIWVMDTAGTSQPNYGDGGTLALTLTSARDTSAQNGTEGRFPLTSDTGDRAYATVEGTSDLSIVVCLNLTSTTASRAIFGGNNYGNNANPGYLAINNSGHLAYQNSNITDGVVLTETPSTGVWLMALTINSSGSLNAYARKVGGSLLSQTFNRGAAVSGSDFYVLGGNGSNYFSALGDYYFLAVYDAVIDSDNFNELYSCIS